MIDTVALRGELDSDPLGFGYSGKSDDEVVLLLNAVGGAGEVGRRVVRNFIETWEIWGATVKTEFDALTASEKQFYMAMISCGKIDPSAATVRGNIVALFGAGTTTRTNLMGLQYVGASRAEVLFGENVHLWDVERARAI